MDLIKKLTLPEDYTPPVQLTYEDLIARPLTRSYLADDLAGVNSSIETIQKTRGGSWPTEELTKNFDLLDLAWHEREFRDLTSLAYVVYTNQDDYVGCFYLYPIGERTPYNDQTKHYDVDASWWVTHDMYEKGYYRKLQTALVNWLEGEFPFNNVCYSNKEQ